METKDRKICFILNAAAIFLIIVIVYLNHELLAYSLKQLKPASNGIYYGPLQLYLLQFAYYFSAFLCSLLLQGEEILTIFHRRKSLMIRWEMIFLGIIALLLALIGIWLPLLFPEHNYGIFSELIYSILSSYLWSFACVFASGVFFVRAFHVQDRIMSKKERIIWFIWSVLMIFFFVLIVYLNRELRWYLAETAYITKILREIDPYYILYPLNLISAFVCSLLLLGENISTIIRRRKALLIRLELLILGAVAIILGSIKMWFVLKYNNIIFQSDFDISFPIEINKIITLNDFWHNALMFAAAMLFARAFHIKIDQSDLEDNNLPY